MGDNTKKIYPNTAASKQPSKRVKNSVISMSPTRELSLAKKKPTKKTPNSHQPKLRIICSRCSLVGCPMALTCTQSRLQWVHSQVAFLYQVKCARAEVGRQFLFVRKCSPGHKSVQKANKQHPEVPYVTKKMHLPTKLPHSTACWLLFICIFLTHQARKHHFTFISQHSGVCHLPPGLYGHICVRVAGGRQRRTGFHG